MKKLKLVTERLTRQKCGNGPKRADFFWTRFIKEYLPSLTQRKKWKEKRQNLKEGDAVLVAEPNQPRGVWPLGRIVSTHLGQDGLVRAVTVRNQHGEYKKTNQKTLLSTGSGIEELIIVSTNIVSRLGAGMCLPLPKLSFPVALLCYEWQVSSLLRTSSARV